MKFSCDYCFQLPSEECLRTFGTSVDNSTINRLVNSFVMPLQILLVTLGSAADLTHKWLLFGFFRVLVNHMALESFLQHDDFANGTFDINFDVSMNGFPVVLHVTSSLESFTAAFFWTKIVFRSMVDSLDMIFQIIRSVCGKRAHAALLILLVFMRQFVLSKKKLGVITLRTQ